MIVNGTAPNLRFEGTFAEIQAMDLNAVPINATFFATDLQRQYGVKNYAGERHLYLEGKPRDLCRNRRLGDVATLADDYAVGSTAVDEAGKRYVVRVGSKGDYEWVPEKAASAPEAAPQPAETKTAPVRPAMKVQSNKPTHYGVVRPDPVLQPIGARFIMTNQPQAFEVTQQPFWRREWTQVRCGFEGTFAELLQLNSSGTQFPVGMTFDATDIGRKFVVKQLDNAFGATRVFCLDDGTQRLLQRNAVFKFTSANACEIGSTAVDDEGKRYVVSFNSEGDHCWRLLDGTPAKIEPKQASKPEPTHGAVFRDGDKVFVCLVGPKGEQRAWIEVVPDPACIPIKTNPSADGCVVGSFFRYEGVDYKCEFNTFDGHHYWEAKTTASSAQSASNTNSVVKGFAAKSDKPTIHAPWAERPSVGDLPAGTRFIATDSLAACEIVSMPHAGREWVSIPCRFHGTVAEMLAMSPDELPLKMLFQCFEEKRNYSVFSLNGKKFWGREDGKIRRVLHVSAHGDRPEEASPADDHIVGSTMTCASGGKYVVKLNSEGDHEWVPETFGFEVSVSLPKPNVVGRMIRVDHELFICCEQKSGEPEWVKVCEARPEPRVEKPRFSVYVLWSHQGWALAADNLDEDQAEAKRADVIRSEYDDDHEQILAVEVFPMGTTPGQLGVPPKEIA